MNIWKKQYTMRRYQAQKVGRKGYVTTGYEDIPVMLNVQPLSNDELEVIPEGSRSVKRIKCFGDFPFATANQKTGVQADRLFFEGKWYECEMSVLWDHTPLKHYRSQFVQVSEAEPDNAVEPPSQDGGSS
ncbi:hypothetical protein [Calorimonas adulescens]|jgi:hypothetical protein|uniref:Uncharacterized protein n=1 Tax=Calorimonas adulescens TaxID=2606906 RepID=A0A5D8QH19_9THEO|nr:hypothetical protein [Calorimonas adulescens]TZE83539.1 hypothetical protein FWJ32_01265 [Calorimonas adulescens]